MSIVKNAIILAAGTSSRFAPLSYEKHKALTVVKGEVLIERQIKQIKQAGINSIYIVTGYKAEQFDYLKKKYGVILINNKEYLRRNNNSSIWVAKELIGSSYICSSDNYFLLNPFEKEVEESYYAAEYCDGNTNEWCLEEDKDGYICSVEIGGSNKWYMLGHTYWDERFSQNFLSILESEYYLEETKGKLWEDIYVKHLDVLKMKIKKYPSGSIAEFDSLDDLRQFDKGYYSDSKSNILKYIAKELEAKEQDIINIKLIKNLDFDADGFVFDCNNKKYSYIYSNKTIHLIQD